MNTTPSLSPHKRSPRRWLWAFSLLLVFAYMDRSGWEDAHVPHRAASPASVAPPQSSPPLRDASEGAVLDLLEIHRQLGGEKRPAEQVQRGDNLRRVFDEPRLRTVTPAAESAPMLSPFTAGLPLRADEQVPDGHLAVSVLALGISHTTFATLAEQEHPRLRIPLEAGLSVTFQVNTVRVWGPVTHSYFGVIEEHPESIAQLVYNDGAVTGHFVLYDDGDHPTRHYEIKFLSEDLVAVHTLNPEAFRAQHGQECQTCALGAELAAGPDAEEELVPLASVAENHATNGRVVDVVIGYGREARQADGGVANIEARMIAAVDRMNQAFVNSQVNGRVVLLGMMEDPDYLEANYSMSQTLYALNAGWHPSISNPLETVRAFRLTLGADLIHFVMNQAEYGGLAYVTNWTSVTRRDQVTTARFSFEHELGHNLGALHAWGDTSTDLTKDHARYGWRFRRASGSNPRRTIMAYDWNWSHVLHFSNPSVSYSISGEAVKTGAVPGYNASADPTVDPDLVSGGAIGGQGAGYNGTNPALGANVAGWFNDASNSGIARAASRVSRAGLAVTRPTGGTTLSAWESTSLEWIGGTWSSPVRLELYQGGVKVADIAALPQNGQRVFAWTPGPGLSGPDFRIRVVNNEGQAFEESAFSGVFAIDAPPIPEYTVSYLVNGAEGAAPAAALKYHNQPFALSGAGELRREGHSFAGWNTQADGGGLAYQPGDVYTTNADLTLHAQWVTGYTVVIDFGKPGQETGGNWNNVTGSGDWPDDALLLSAPRRYADGGQTGIRLRAQRVASSARGGIGSLDIAADAQDALASFAGSGTIPASAQRDIAYASDTGAVQFVFENLDDTMSYRLSFQSLHTTSTAAANWTVHPEGTQPRVLSVDRNKGGANYNPVQVFEGLSTDGSGRIVLRSSGNVAQNINAMELTAAFAAEAPDPAQPENPGGGTGTTYYLDASAGNDSHSGLSETSAWQTLQKAIDTLQPGDTVLIREGDYFSSGNDEYKNWNIHTSGAPGQYITYRAYPGERPRFHVDTWNGIQLWNAAYIEIDGLEVLGLPDPAGLAAEPDNSDVRKTLAQDRRYFGGGITVTHNGTEPHHIRIRNNVVHQVGGNGIGFRGGNMLLVEGNTVRNSTHRSDAGNSAISFVELNSDIHPSAGYGVVVRNNTLYDNHNRVAFKSVGYITDGNGIIIDYSPAYSGDRILIANNLAYNNGGRAVHVYNGRNVDILHNTAYHNLASPDLQWAGELSSDAPGDSSNSSILFHNNIAVARSDRRAYHIANTDSWTFTHNLVNSPRAPAHAVDANNLLNTDPLFVDAAEADFRLLENSPALDAGLVFAPESGDHGGNMRPQGTDPDLGAFEGAVSPPGDQGPQLLLRHSFTDAPAIAIQHSSATFRRQSAADFSAAGITASDFFIRNDAGNPARVIATDSVNAASGAAQIAGIESRVFQWEPGGGANPYFEFSLSGAASLDSIRIVARSGSQWNNSGAFLAYDANRQAEFSVRSSLDNYGSTLGAVFTAGSAGAFSEQLLDLSALNVSGQTVTFRIYPRSPNPTDAWDRAQVERVDVSGTLATASTDAYEVWAAANGIVGGGTDLSDGVPNLLRYAMGGDADTPASAFRLQPLASGAGMGLSFPRVEDPRLTYEIWATDHLFSWGDSPLWSGKWNEPAPAWIDLSGDTLFLHLRVRRE